jgi:hypothetical protein
MKLWNFTPEDKTLSFLRHTNYTEVKFGNFFKVSSDGQILYMNYSKLGIDVIDPSQSDQKDLKPSKTINCPLDDGFVDMAPL